jgi:ABC-type transport system involved in multi-copper enzyme maturation permease subunit
MLIANIVIFLILASMFIGMAEADAPSLVNLIVQGTFLIWQSILISKLIIDEFKTRTIQHLFTYPLKRSAVMGAKIVLISGMMLGFILVTQVIQHSLLSVMAQVLPGFNYVLSMQSIVVIALTSSFAVMVGMFPIAVGLWTNSNIAPVITAVLILSVFGGSYGEAGTLDLFNNLAAMSTIGIIGLVLGIYSIRDILKKDLII